MRQKEAGSASPEQRKRSRSVANQLTRRTLLAVGLPLAVCVALAALGGRWLSTTVGDRVDEARRELAETTVGEVKAGQSGLVLARLDDLLGPLVAEVAATGQLPEITAALSATYPAAEELAPAGAEQAEAALDGVLDASGATSRLLAQRAGAVPIITSMLVTDSNGFAVGGDRLGDRSVYRADGWWEEAWTTGASIGAIERNGPEEPPSVVIAVRAGTGGEELGVVRATIDLAAVQAVADTVADPAAGVQVVVAATDGTLLAESATGHDPSRIAGGVDALEGRDPAFAQVLASDAARGFQTIGDLVVGYGRLSPNRVVPGLDGEVANPRWVAMVEEPTDTALAAAAPLDQLDNEASRLGRVAPLAAAAAALLALVLAAVLARSAARRITRPLDQLSRAAFRLAEHDLPALLQPGSSGQARPVSEPVQVDADTELVDLASAFNSMQRSAIELAADQAVDRTREVATVLVNLGRRNQQLIGRQLRFIDSLERAESNPDTLRNLFILDQMATRMRRNAESLLVLAGEESPRRGTQPRAVDEVVRAATSEVEEFARVSIRSMEQVLIDPRVLSDLTHLLAELIENATLFSPPDATVEINGNVEGDGSYTISIVDHGLGLPSDRLHEANSRIADAAQPGTPASSFMGLFVVGRLAARHGIGVQLVDTPDSGLTAVVHLPLSCLGADHEPVTDVRGSRIHISGPLTGPYRRSTAPPPRRTRSTSQSRPVTGGAVTSGSATGDGTPVAGGVGATPVVAEAAPTPTLPPTEDESEGLPIPPFRSREARRVPASAGSGSSEGGGNEGDQRFQVRKRVRKTADEQGARPGGAAPDEAAPETAEPPEARAEAVRNRLNRFTTGVQAAKRQAATGAGVSSPEADATGEPPTNDTDTTADLATSVRAAGRSEDSGPAKEES